MNDDELRSILKSEADRVEVGDNSWSRLESRFAIPPAHSAPRAFAFAFGTVGIGVLVALVVGVIWVLRDEPGPRIASSPNPSGRGICVGADLGDERPPSTGGPGCAERQDSRAIREPVLRRRHIDRGLARWSRLLLRRW